MTTLDSGMGPPEIGAFLRSERVWQNVSRQEEKKKRRAEARPLHRARRVGIEAFLVEEEDAGAEREEHDGDASGDAEAGSHGCGTIVTATDDDVARNDDQVFQDARLEQPGDEFGYRR